VQKDDYIFVYGTLRRGEVADLRKQAHNFDVLYICEDSVNGNLYDIGAFPGAKLLTPVQPEFDPKLPLIVGEVFRIRNTAICAILDHYEGYEPDAPEQGHYNRCKVPSKSGKDVWIYTYNPFVRSEQMIPGGDWCKARIVMPRRSAFG
jgi:gamma-glutamylcyclotransferase (GGCT)/AIG2-like uncharacterized protein YtfP